MPKSFRSRGRRSAAVLLTCALLACAHTAHASPLLDLVGDTGSTGALSARVSPGGSAAAYFNPALLVEGRAEATVGFMLLAQRIGITLYGRPGAEFAVPEGLENAEHADGTRFDNYALPTHDLQFGRMKTTRKAGFVARPRQGVSTGQATNTYEVAGILVKMFDQRLALGLHVLVPNGEFTKLRAFFNDEREQYFSNSLHPELYSDRMTSLSLALGAGIKLSDALSIGAGATLSLQANVVAPTFVVDASALDRILIDMNTSVNIGITPHFGVSYRPVSRLRLTATAHAPQKVELGTSFTFLLANGIEQASGVTFVLDYTPWQIGAGAAFDILQARDQTLSLTASGLYATWSSYLDRHGTTPTPAYAWSNTLSPTLGVRYRWHDLQTVLDVSYVPTPVPLQTGRTNYVDNDRVSGALGADYLFAAFGTKLRVGAQVQLHSLLERSQKKLETPTSAEGRDLAPERVKDELPDDARISGAPVAGAGGLQTNNPGWPGFSSGGFILGGTLYVAVAL